MLCNAMANKRAQEQLYMYVFYTIMVIIILAALVYFVSDVSSGKTIKKQVISKKLSMLLDSAKPNAIIELDSKDIDINREKSMLILKIKGDEIAYKYEFYNQYGIDIIKEKNKTTIKIEK